jgi:hypothetical protein
MNFSDHDQEYPGVWVQNKTRKKYGELYQISVPECKRQKAESRLELSSFKQRQRR